MSAEFIPLLSPVTGANSPGNAAQNLKIVPPASAKSVFKPLIPAEPALSHSAENCSKPTVTVERKGDSISAIRIQCGCGNVIELNCLH